MKSSKIFFVSILLFFSAAVAEEKSETVCLNMIVKDESHVIKRCLTSVKPLIDYWVIVDTGSSDGTQEIIKTFMQDIPGELHEQPWINFGHNRNEALKLAKNKADYTLFIDADEIFVFDSTFKLPKLKHDFYYITTHFGGMHYGRVQLIKNSLNWEWKGVLHEALESKEAKSSQILEGIYDQVYTDGARSHDPDKFKKDARLLEEALAKEPNNSRYQFYYAQSLRDAGEAEKALKAYKKRISMGGWDQEIYWSMLQVAMLQEKLEEKPEIFLKSYYTTYHLRPTRVEPLYQLANYYRRCGNYAQGYLIAKTGLTVPHSRDVLFVEKWMSEWGLLLEASICAYWVGKYDECQKICQELLSLQELPEHVQTCVKNNLTFANQKLVELHQNELIAQTN